jgi:hypothetical protein
MFYYTLEELCQTSLKHLDSEKLLDMALEMQQRLEQAQPAGETWRRVDQQSREIQELKAQCQEHLRELSCFQSHQDSSWRLD